MFVLLLQSIKNDHETTIANFRQEVEASRTEIEETVRASLEPLREEISTALNQRDCKIIEAEKEIASLKDEFKKLKNAADEQDAYVRRESLIFSGELIPAVTEGENCRNIVRKLIREDLNLQIDPLISTAHRMGKPPADESSPDKRDIVVRFSQRDDKFRVYETAKKKQIKGLYANESLTPTRRIIKKALLKMKKLHADLVRGVTTHNGRVFVLTKPAPNAPETARNIRTEINTMDRLSSFCAGFVKQPMSNFLTNN